MNGRHFKCPAALNQQLAEVRAECGRQPHPRYYSTTVAPGRTSNPRSRPAAPSRTPCAGGDRGFIDGARITCCESVLVGKAARMAVLHADRRPASSGSPVCFCAAVFCMNETIPRMPDKPVATGRPREGNSPPLPFRHPFDVTWSLVLDASGDIRTPENPCRSPMQACLSELRRL